MTRSPPTAVPGTAPLLERYTVVLLDAYGVLVDKAGPLPGAVELIDHLNATDKRYFVLTNSASRLPATMSRDFHARGLAIPVQRIISSGVLLGTYFGANDLVGRDCVVLGTRESISYVHEAGGRTVDVRQAEEAAAVILADQAGFALIDTLDETLSLILRRMDRDDPLHLVLCNPDLIYPRAPGHYGFTAGALAAMMEAVLRQRYPGHNVSFTRLGKPYAPIFQEAVRRSGSQNMLMIGDQLATDVQGAQRFGIDSALVTTGLARIEDAPWTADIFPTYLLASLSPR